MKHRSLSRPTATALGFALACACGGGGGGGPVLPPPVVVAAAFVGAGAVPVQGDLLILFLSQDVAVTGALLNDADVLLSGGTLGTVAAPPTLRTTRSVQLALGAGVSLIPGTTTIAFSSMNDAVRSTSGVAAAAGAPIMITAGDGDDPSIDLLTLNAVPVVLNGTGPAGGVLQVPRRAFTIDLQHSDPTSPIDPARTSITANVAVGGVAAGGELVPLLTASPGPTASSYLVPNALQFPDGAVVVTAVVVDATGMSSQPASFAFTVRDATTVLRPLESGQTWYLDTTRDVESFAHDPGNTVHPVSVIDGSNGLPDQLDLYFIVGLFGADPAVNGTVRTAIQDAVLVKLGALHAGVTVTFTFTAPGTFPPGSITLPYASFAFSQMCIAGSFDATGQSGILGYAILDEHNETQDNDCTLNFAGARLGVFLHAMIDVGMRPPATTKFRLTYNALAPGLAGIPIGNHPDGQDPARLAGTLQDPRTTTIANAIDRMAAAIAVIAAHECGHSMGLVKDGAMPTGLYGGDPVNFPGSTSGHINNSGAMFPGAAQNIMSPAIGFVGATDPGTAFNPLNLAYLRERVLYNQ